MAQVVLVGSKVVKGMLVGRAAGKEGTATRAVEGLVKVAVEAMVVSAEVRAERSAAVKEGTRGSEVEGWATAVVAMWEGAVYRAGAAHLAAVETAPALTEEVGWVTGTRAVAATVAAETEMERKEVVEALPEAPRVAVEGVAAAAAVEATAKWTPCIPRVSI